MQEHTFLGIQAGIGLVENLSTIPVIALALGPVAGLGAARAVTSHFSIMVKDLSQMFVAGPPVVKRVGEDLTKEELGGSEIHSKNGAIDIVVNSEKEAIETAKNILTYLPSSVYDLPQGLILMMIQIGTMNG